MSSIRNQELSIASFRLPIGNLAPWPIGTWRSAFANQLQPRLNLASQRAEVGHALQFVIRELDAEVILQFRQQVERLQAVDAECLKEVVIGGELFARNLEMRGGEGKDFIERLIGCLHSSHSIFIRYQLGQIRLSIGAFDKFL